MSRRATPLSPPALLMAATLVTGLVAALGASAPPAARKSAVERGRYLVTIAACGDCHTPLKFGPNGPEPDMSKWLSGAPGTPKMPPPPAVDAPWMMVATNAIFAGPWGISYAANLTPDARTGLGAWTAEQFVATMKQGRHAGSGRPIAPPMPWQALGTLDEADLRAMFAYLKSQPAVSNAVPALQALAH